MTTTTAHRITAPTTLPSAITCHFAPSTPEHPSVGSSSLDWSCGQSRAFRPLTAQEAVGGTTLVHNRSGGVFERVFSVDLNTTVWIEHGDVQKARDHVPL